MVNDTSCTDLLVTGVSFAALIERSTQNRNNNRTANEGPSLFPRFPFLCRDAFHAGQNVTGFSNTFFTGFDAPWQTAFLFPPRTKPLSLSPPSISPSFSLLHFPFSPFFWIGSGAFCSISESRAISRGWWSPRLDSRVPPSFRYVCMFLWWLLQRKREIRVKIYASYTVSNAIFRDS